MLRRARQSQKEGKNKSKLKGEKNPPKRKSKIQSA